MNVGAIAGWIVLGIIVVMLIAVVTVVVLMRTGKRDQVMAFLRKILPPVAKVSGKLSASRIAGMLGMMLSGGFPIESALEMSANALEDEESISGMPINMEGFCLFDTEHTSSMPLNLAYKAAQLTHPAKAEQFLYNLRFATVVDCRPTTRTEEIMVVARKTGLDEQVFLDHFNSHTTRDELELDLQFGRKLGIYSLPSYLIQWGNRGVLIQSFHYGDFLTAIEKVTEWTVRPVPVEPTADGLRSLIQNHPLISPIEIRETLDLNSTEEVEELLQPLLQAGEVTIQPVPHGWFVRKESES